MWVSFHVDLMATTVIEKYKAKMKEMLAVVQMFEGNSSWFEVFMVDGKYMNHSNS